MKKNSYLDPNGSYFNKFINKFSENPWRITGRHSNFNKEHELCSSKDIDPNMMFEKMFNLIGFGGVDFILTSLNKLIDNDSNTIKYNIDRYNMYIAANGIGKMDYETKTYKAQQTIIITGIGELNIGINASFSDNLFVSLYVGNNIENFTILMRCAESSAQRTKFYKAVYNYIADKFNYHYITNGEISINGENVSPVTTTENL